MSAPVSNVAADGEPGIALFFILEQVVTAGLEVTLVELLEDQGHERLLVAKLTAAQIAAAAGELAAPWAAQLAASGEVIAALTIDLLPMAQGSGADPGFDNPKILKATERADFLLQSLAGGGGSDALIATSHSGQAWRIVRALWPDREAQLRAAADRLRADFATEGAIRSLTREGRRAKVELVRVDGELAVRKTFRPSALAYMAREIEVLERLSPVRPEVPKLVGRGDRHILVSFIADGRDLALEHRGGRPTPLPLPIVRALADFIKACVAAGFDPIDIRAPGNVILTPAGLKVIDFELWRHCPPGTRPEDALCLTGVSAGDAERPRAVRAFAKPYSTAWFPLTLLPVESFLYDPASLQRLKRGANLVRVWSRRALNAAARRAGGGRE